MKFTLKTILFLFVLRFLNVEGAVSQDITSNILIQKEDIQIINSVIVKFKNDKDLSTGELIVKIGKYFLETPYVPYTLEGNINEYLVVNLREMDCTTFAEYCLALARTVKSADPVVSDFYNELRMIRYRGGVLDAYPSRLHYFSDWIYDNTLKKIVEDITQKAGGIALNADVSYMSKHPVDYSALKLHPEFIEIVRKQEKEISGRKISFIPKDHIEKSEKLINDGDIIGITCDIEGMDIMHVVIAIWQKGQLHILHASQSAEKVLISEDTLEEYLKRSKKATGIVVVRAM